METLAIIIPTLTRSDRIKRILENIAKTTKAVYQVYFILDSQDLASIQMCKALNAKALINYHPSRYVSAINFGYKQTKEPFLFLGADDIEFTQGWDTTMLSEMSDPKIGVVGAYDNWPIGKTGFHGSHLLVRRSYIQTFSGVEDEADVVYSTAYRHYNSDIETEQTAMKRGAYKQSKAVIEHHHWMNNEAEKDSTYALSLSENLQLDQAAYTIRRKRFEQYYLEELQQGRVYPVHKGKLSIVIGSYNAPKALRWTIESLYEQTYHDFELIIVDDHSTNPQTIEYIREIPYQNVKRFFLQEQGYTTHTWNVGVSKATGDYIVVANNDITFSKHWDVYLMNVLSDKEIYLANPYQTDDGMREPYGKHERAGGLDIRGICYAMTKESAKVLFPLPENLVMWFSDFWLAWKVAQLKKKSVFVKEAVVHNMGSKSSIDLEQEKEVFWWILRGDAYTFQNMTGVDTSHWLEVIRAHLPYFKRI